MLSRSRQISSIGDVRDWGQRVGLGAIYLFGLASFVAPAGAATGMVLLWVAFIATVDDWRSLLRQPVILTALALVLFLLLQSLLTAWRSPELAGQIRDGAWGWLQLLVFLPFAFFLAADSRRLRHILLLALAGLALRMLLHLDWQLLHMDPQRFLSTRTRGYGFPAIGFALYSGTAVLGLILLARRWWSSGSGVWGLSWRIATWLLFTLLLAQGLILTYSRGSWIAFLAALVAGFWLVRRQTDRTSGSISGWRPILVGGAAILAVFLALNGEKMVERMTTELDSARALASGESRDIPMSSVTLRWHAQRIGFSAWRERPWLGWGAETSRPLMTASGDERVRTEEGVTIEHLHNTYLEILVQFGLIGLIGSGLLIYLLVRGLRRAEKADALPGDYATFLLAAFVLTLVWCLFDYRAVHQDWRIFWTLLAGSAMSFSLPAGMLPRTGLLAARREEEAA